MQAPDALATIDQIAQLLSVSKKTIYYWIGRNEIPYLRVGKHLRFDKQRVLQHFADKTEDQKPTFFQNQAVLKPSSWTGRIASPRSMKTENGSRTETAKE